MCSVGEVLLRCVSTLSCLAVPSEWACAILLNDTWQVMPSFSEMFTVKRG